MKLNYKSMFVSLLILNACAIKSIKESRVVIDNSFGNKNSLPEWVRDSRASWIDPDSKHLKYKTTYTIRGDQRTNACFELAKLEIKQNVISEISTSITGELNLASDGMNENSEIIITKSFNEQFSALVKGLKFESQFFERYVIADNERIDCFVQATMSPEDYQLLKKELINKMEKMSSQVAEAVRKKQVNFFNENGKNSLNVKDEVQ